MDQVQTTQATEIVKPLPKYLEKRQARKRCTFGHVWLQAVLAGVVTDHTKLVAHAVHLQIGRKYDLQKLKFETLLSKVQSKIMAS